MGPRGVPGAAGGGGRRVRILEKQKIKMSKMAATAAIFGILIFCFSKTGTKLPGPIGLATSGSQRSGLATSGYKWVSGIPTCSQGINPGCVQRSGLKMA